MILDWLGHTLVLTVMSTLWLVVLFLTAAMYVIALPLLIIRWLWWYFRSRRNPIF